jgi:anti-sigma regulatory factor (Ser/Thr protein kinase)
MKQDGYGPRPRLPLRARFRRREAAGPVERLVLRTPAAFRRRVIGAAVLAVIALAGVSVFLSWRSYHDSRHRDVAEQNARVFLVRAVVDSYMTGGISTLEAVAQAPVVVDGKPAAMDAYLRRVGAGGARIFDAGLGWVDTQGTVRASSTGASLDVADRLYFQQPMTTGQPYVSAGLIGRRLRQPIIVVAVPTRGPTGGITGVLTGGIRLQTFGRTRLNSDLGFEGLTIVDRNGRLILSNLAPVTNRAVLAQLERAGTGDLTNTPGLTGGSGHVIAFTTATVPAWKIAIDRPASSLFAAARHTLIIELALLGAAVAAILAILMLLAKRSRREIETRGEQAQSWSRLTRNLASAATASDVADALLDSLETVFPDAVIVVAVDSETGEEVRATSTLPGWRRVPGDTRRLRTLATLPANEAGTRPLDRGGKLRDVYLSFGRRLKALHGHPITGESGDRLGGVALLTERSSLTPSEWELLSVFVAQTAAALDRARTAEHEHEVAVLLQRSFLPTRLPSAPGVALTGEYMAGGPGVEVGGDWYDAVARPDGILQLCVGDVSGRGVDAATVMGRQRGAFRAYAQDWASPAEIFRRLLRHVNDDEMITAACVTLDPIAGRIGYSCAGHPPPLLLDRDTGEIVRLDGAGAPPLGVAGPDDIVEAWLPLPLHTRLALYTDGLVERRGMSVDDGIDELARLTADDPGITPGGVLSAISGTLGAPDDDVALLLATLDPAPGFEIELPSSPETLGTLRARLRAWLSRAGVDEEAAGEIVLAASEAVTNAIEHAYHGRGPGVVGVAAQREDDRLTLEITDRGRWRKAEPSDERGRGVLLMHGLMDRVEIDTGEVGTRIVLERRVAQPLPAVAAVSS